jgi:integrase
MVSVPPAMSATGKRIRRFFADSKKAEKFGASVRAKHTAGSRGLLTAELAMQAGEAVRILGDSGISLIEAARIAVRTVGNTESAEVFSDRWARVVDEMEPHWSKRYALDMAKVPRWMGKAAMAMRCGELTQDVVQEALKAHGAASISTLKMREARVMAVLKHKPRVRRTRDIQILTPRQAARVLRACKTADERRVVALLLFAGIRPDAEMGEISRLQWEAVGETEIYVSPEASKVADRHVPITPRLRRLLRGHAVKGPVRPAMWRRSWQRIRREAGISAMQDVLRHTFASNFLAAFGEDAAKQAMGHTKGSDTLFRHYRRAVTKEAGLRFFSVRQE